MDIRDNPARSRYEMDLEGGRTAYIDYRKSPGVVTLVYAMVPPALRGQGHGARLTQRVLDLIRTQGDKVIPHCGFVATYMRRHPEYADLLLKP